MRNVVQLCLAANNILVVRKRNHAFLFLSIALARKWQLPKDIYQKTNSETESQNNYHKKGFSLSLVSKVRVFELGNGLMSWCTSVADVTSCEKRSILGFEEFALGSEPIGNFG